MCGKCCIIAAIFLNFVLLIIHYIWIVNFNNEFSNFSQLFLNKLYK